MNNINILGSKYKTIIFIGFCLMFIASFSCKKFVEIDPPKTQLVSPNVFISDATATTAMIGIYSKIMSSQFGIASGGTTQFAGLSSDELKDNSAMTEQIEFYQNSLSINNSIIDDMWSRAYNIIYATNSVIEGLTNSIFVSESIKKQLEGEAKFTRALFSFYLVNLYGDIPYLTTTDYRINSLALRTTKVEVYQKIIADLKDAQILLGDNYVDKNNAATSERVRPNKWVATALLARVLLYNRNWIDAESEATVLINNTSKFTLVTDLNAVFLKNSSETIWQLMPVSSGYNT